MLARRSAVLASVLVMAIALWRETWTLRHTVVSAVALATFAAVVLGGYLGDWHWTRFHGDTLWNWLHLWLCHC